MIRKFRKYLLAVVIVASAFLSWKVSTGQFAFNLNLSFENGPALLIDALIFASVCLVLTFAYVSRRFKMKNVLFKSALIALWSLVLPAGIHAVSGYCKITPLIMSMIYAVVAILFLVVYFYKRKREGDKVSSTAIRKSAEGSGQIRYAYSIFFALIMILSVAFVSELVITMIQKGQIVPPIMLGSALIAYIIWRLIHWRGILLIEVIYLIFTQLTYFINSIALNCEPAVSDLGYFLVTVAMITVISDLYCRKEKSI